MKIALNLACFALLAGIAGFALHSLLGAPELLWLREHARFVVGPVLLIAGATCREL